MPDDLLSYKDKEQPEQASVGADLLSYRDAPQQEPQAIGGGDLLSYRDAPQQAAPAAPPTPQLPANTLTPGNTAQGTGRVPSRLAIPQVDVAPNPIAPREIKNPGRPLETPSMIGSVLSQPLEAAKSQLRNAGEAITRTAPNLEMQQAQQKARREQQDMANRSVRNFAENDPETFKEFYDRSQNEPGFNISEAMARHAAQKQYPFLDQIDAEQQQLFIDPYRERYGTATIEQQQEESERASLTDIGKVQNITNAVAGTAGQMIYGPAASAADLLAAPLRAAGYDVPSARKAVSEAFEKNAPLNPEYADSFLLSKLPSGATSMAMFALTAGAGGAANAGKYATSLGVSLGLDEGYAQTLQKENPSVLDSLILIGGHGLLGATEAIPIGRFFERMNDATGGQFARSLTKKLASSNPLVNKAARVGASAVQQAVEEAIQEGGQAGLSVLLDYQTSPEKYGDFWGAVQAGGDAAVEGMSLGGVLGGIMGGGGALISPVQRQGVPQPTAPELDNLSQSAGQEGVATDQPIAAKQPQNAAGDATESTQTEPDQGPQASPGRSQLAIQADDVLSDGTPVFNSREKAQEYAQARLSRVPEGTLKADVQPIALLGENTGRFMVVEEKLTPGEDQRQADIAAQTQAYEREQAAERQRRLKRENRQTNTFDPEAGRAGYNLAEAQAGTLRPEDVFNQENLGSNDRLAAPQTQPWSQTADDYVENANTNALKQIDNIIQQNTPESSSTSTVGGSPRSRIYEMMGVPGPHDAIEGDNLFRIGLMRNARQDNRTIDFTSQAFRQRLSDAFFRHEAESQGLDPEGLLGPMSGYTEEGKVRLVESAAHKADTLIGELQKLMPRIVAEDDAIRQHRDSVSSALREGKPVPAEVLADYPDLAKQYGKTEEKPAATASPETARPATREQLAAMKRAGLKPTKKTTRDEADRALAQVEETSPAKPASKTDLAESPTARSKRIRERAKALGIDTTNKTTAVVEEEIAARESVDDTPRSKISKSDETHGKAVEAALKAESGSGTTKAVQDNQGSGRSAQQPQDPERPSGERIIQEAILPTESRARSLHALAQQTGIPVSPNGETPARKSFDFWGESNPVATYDLSNVIFRLQNGNSNPDDYGYGLYLIHMLEAVSESRDHIRPFIVANALHNLAKGFREPDTYFDPLKLDSENLGEDIENTIRETATDDINERTDRMITLLGESIADGRVVVLDQLSQASNPQYGDPEAGGEFGDSVQAAVFQDAAKQIMRDPGRFEEAYHKAKSKSDIIEDDDTDMDAALRALGIKPPSSNQAAPKQGGSARNRGIATVPPIADSAAKWLRDIFGNTITKANDAYKVLKARFGEGIRKHMKAIWSAYKQFTSTMKNEGALNAGDARRLRSHLDKGLSYDEAVAKVVEYNERVAKARKDAAAKRKQREAENKQRARDIRESRKAGATTAIQKQINKATGAKNVSDAARDQKRINLAHAMGRNLGNSEATEKMQVVVDKMNKKEQTAKDARKEIVGLVKHSLPKRYHGKYLNAVAKAKTPRDIENAVFRIQSDLARIDRADLIKLVRKAEQNGGITKADSKTIIGMIYDGATAEQIGEQLRKDRIESDSEPMTPDGFGHTSPAHLRHILSYNQDKMREVWEVQRSIGRSKGVKGRLEQAKLPEDQDTYLAEELRSRKTQNQIESGFKRYIQPITQILARANIDISNAFDKNPQGDALPSFNTYLIARHAGERNSAMRERAYGGLDQVIPGLAEDPAFGSGMSDELAESIMDTVAKSDQSKDYERAARIFDRMNKEYKRLLVAYGLESQETIDSWDEMFEFYAPLRTDMAALEPELRQGLGIGRGIDIRGKEQKKAKGRRTLADEPLAHAFLNLQNGIIRAQKNAVGQSFLSMVRANPDPDVWKVLGKDESPRVGWETLGVKEGGEEIKIAIAPKHAGIAKAMKNLGVEELGSVIRGVGNITRTMAALFTRWNPVFPPINLMRDVQGVNLTVAGEQGVLSAAAVDAKLPMAFAALYNQSRKGVAKRHIPADQASYWNRMAQEYKESGAPISFLDLNNLQTAIKAIRREMNDAKPGINPLKQVMRGIRESAGYIADINDVAENSARLAVYAVARDNGMSKARAASYAKNISTNFERKGNIGTLMNSLFFFSNAAIQGNARVLEFVLNHKMGAAKIIGGLMVTHATLDILNYLLAGEDDDGENYYDKMPDYVKRNNIILPLWNDEGKTYMIPAPFVYNFIQSVAQYATQSAMGRRSIPDAALGTAAAMTETFNPLGGSGGDPIYTAVPSAIKPFYEIQNNRDWQGREIYDVNPFAKFDAPDSELFRKNTPEWLVSLTRSVNKISGGNEYRKGWMDFSPDTFMHLYKFYSGGLGKTLEQAWVTSKNAYTDRPVETHTIPLVRRFRYTTNPRLMANRFYDDYRSEIERVSKMVRDGVNLSDTETAVYGLKGYLTATEEQLKALRENRDQHEYYSNQWREVDKQIDAAYARFNKNYLDTMKQLN